MHAVSSVVIKRDLYKLNSVGIVKSKPVGWQRALFGNCLFLLVPLFRKEGLGEIIFDEIPPNLPL
ncbi:hypothetical protein D9K79_16950 [Acinetobacter cumulans]|uniref:Uncharacterized protein n=1 Tax=Acinetobacter cumulans TaxID=2136182 RepID=A0ABX9U1L4_9GAMM|nr:hypothetical protein DYI81_16335 [Acinetobacter sp. SWAC5]RKG44535.1 hypothetical protein D7V51_07190 [Acinetobacter cumulans]RKG51811.1 hypothetical protein D7V68_00405 [Acinetobacter cumulans]RLL37680.1 hypothetical protein D9K79_16950 [Acinetobacter cumulans]